MSENILSKEKFLLRGIRVMADSDITTVDFSPVEEIPEGAEDVSEAQDGSVLAFMDGDTMHVCAADDGKVIFPEDSSEMFSSSIVEQILGLDNIDTSNVVDMENMFDGSEVSALDLSSWDVSNVQSIAWMFHSCGQLTSLDLSGWDTSQVKDMKHLFNGDYSLTEINGLDKWDTPSLTDINSIFSECSSLTSLNLSGWNTSNVTNMENIFSDCDSLKSLNLSGWDTSNVTDMSYMFCRCPSLTSLDLSGWDTSNVKNINHMFALCTSLTEIKGVENWDTSNVSNMRWMFADCSSLTSPNLSRLNIPKKTDTGRMFHNCPAAVNFDMQERKHSEASPIKKDSILNQAKSSVKEQDLDHETLNQETKNSPKCDR